MGPECPECGAIHEWTLSEVHEKQVLCPRYYTCPKCYALFSLDPDEIRALQRKIRRAWGL